MTNFGIRKPLPIMEYILIITGLVLIALGATLAIAYSLRKQRDAAMRDVAAIAQRLTDIEKKLEREEKNMGRHEDGETGMPEDVGAHQTSGETRIQEDLSGMSDEELFHYLTKAIKEQELYRWHDFNRSAVMQHFSLSAARVGAAFAQGGGQSLPEYVRKCRLDHFVRLYREAAKSGRKPTIFELAHECGYRSYLSFYTAFWQRMGMSVMAWLRNKEM